MERAAMITCMIGLGLIAVSDTVTGMIFRVSWVFIPWVGLHWWGFVTDAPLNAIANWHLF